MLLAYLDESYDKHRYWIAALVVPEREARSLATALDAVVEKAAVNYGTATTAELHGNALFHGTEDWALLANPKVRARVGIYNEAFQALADHDVMVIIRGVNIPRLKERDGARAKPPHVVVLSHLLERIDEQAEAHDELALVIADEIDQVDVHRRNLWELQRWRTEGYRSRQLNCIVDTMHFSPSRASRLLQAADLIAFMYQRTRSDTDGSRDARAVAANQALWARIEPKVHHCWCWWP